jgi:hypothetical protein
MFLGWACASGASSDSGSTDPTGAGGSDGSTGGSDGSTGGSDGTTGGSGGTSAGPMGTGGGNTAGFPGTGGSAGAKGGAGGATGGSAGSGTAGSSAGGNPGGKGPGSTCATGSECASGKCVDTGHSGSTNMVCVEPCKTGTGCASGTHCTTIGGSPVCISDRDSQCGTCTSDATCKNQGDRCLTTPDMAKFCAQDCGYDSKCPTGYECKAVPMGAAGDKACYPAAGASCACAANRDGATRSCVNMNATATCTGVEKCDGKMGKYTGCTAATPPPAGMCAALPGGCMGTMGGGFPHATCNCTGSNCTLLCDMGFTHYPPSAPESAGCPCAVDKAEPNDMCAASTALPALSDAGTKATKVTGTLSSDADVDWYDVTIGNMPAGGTNQYHVQVTFDMNPSNEFVFQIIRGGDCSKQATAPTLTSYDWCVSWKGADGSGESPCGDMAGLNTCADHSAPYKIGVSRAKGATPSCSQYVLNIQAAAGMCAGPSDACGAMP